MARKLKILMVDNYDSFTYNLVQYLGELGAEVIVKRNDAIDLAGVRALEPDAIVISPGPGTPADAGISIELLQRSSAARSRCSASAWAINVSARPSAARWSAPTA